MEELNFSPLTPNLQYCTEIYDKINDVEKYLNSITRTGELLKEKSLKNVNLRQLNNEISGNLNSIKTLLKTKKFKNLEGEELNNELKTLSDKITKIRDNTIKFDEKFVELMRVKTEECENNIQRRKELLKLNEEIRSQNEEITAEKKEIIKIKEVKEVVDSQKQKCEKKIKRAKRREKAFQIAIRAVFGIGMALILIGTPTVTVAWPILMIGLLFMIAFGALVVFRGVTSWDRLEDEEKLKNLNNL